MLHESDCFCKNFGKTHLKITFKSIWLIKNNCLRRVSLIKVRKIFQKIHKNRTHAWDQIYDCSIPPLSRKVFPLYSSSQQSVEYFSQWLVTHTQQRNNSHINTAINLGHSNIQVVSITEWFRCFDNLVHFEKIQYCDSQFWRHHKNN